MNNCNYNQEQMSSMKTKGANFVQFVINLINKDKGAKAKLSRADNPDTEYQSWEYLAKFGVKLDSDYERLPFSAVAAAIAQAAQAAAVTHNGSLKMGEAIAYCYPDGNKSEQAKAKFRRLLACESVPEVCRILRPLLALIRAKVSGNIDYIQLLQDLRGFSFGDEARQQIKSRWAQNFYHVSESSEE